MKRILCALVIILCLICTTANAAQVIETGVLPGVFEGLKRDNLYITHTGAWWQTGREQTYQYQYAAEYIVFYDDAYGFFFTIKGTDTYVAVRPVQLITISDVVNSFDGWSSGAVFELDDGSSWIQVSSEYRYKYKSRPTLIVVADNGKFYAFEEDMDGKVTVVPAY